MSETTIGIIGPENEGVDPFIDLYRAVPSQRDIPADEVFPPASAKDLNILPYDIDISDWQTKPARYERGIGHLQTSMVYLADGSRYVFRKILAEDPITDVPADFMPPLATRTRGFNKYVGRKLAEAGISNRLVGTNRGHNYSLEHDAQAFLAILNHDDALNNDFQPGESLELGYSMGAMKGLGAMSLAHLMGRNHRAIFIDPCLAERIDYSDENLSDVWAYLRNEGRELRRVVSDDASKGSLLHTVARSIHLMGSFSASPIFLRNMYDKWKVLATGETGTFPDKIPLDAAMVIHFFIDSRYNHKEVYKQKFANHHNVGIVEEDGLHMTGACRLYVAGIASQAVTAVRLIEDGVRNDEFVEAMNYPIAA